MSLSPVHDARDNQGPRGSGEHTDGNDAQKRRTTTPQQCVMVLIGVVFTGASIGSIAGGAQHRVVLAQELLRGMKDTVPGSHQQRAVMDPACTPCVSRGSAGGRTDPTSGHIARKIEKNGFLRGGGQPVGCHLVY